MHPPSDTPKLLFLCASLGVGGAERVWSTLIPNLANMGARVELIAVNKRGELFNQVSDQGIESSFLDAGAGMKAVRCVPAVLQHIRNHNISTIVALGSSAAAIAALVGRLGNVRVVINWHTADRLPRSRSSSIACRLSAWLGAEVICVSEGNLRELRRFGFSDEKIFVVPNGVSSPVSKFAPPPKRQTGGLQVCIVARLAKPKRLDRFIEAIAQASHVQPGIRGVVAGDGPLVTALIALRDEITAPVDFIGLHPNPPELMLSSDIVCLTSDFEAAPLVLLEAAACGRPVVTTDCGDARKIVQHLETGLVTNERTPEAIAESLVTLARNPDLQRSMGQAARRRWEELYSADRMLAGYAHILLASPSAPD